MHIEIKDAVPRVERAEVGVELGRERRRAARRDPMRGLCVELSAAVMFRMQLSIELSAGMIFVTIVDAALHVEQPRAELCIKLWGTIGPRPYIVMPYTGLCVELPAGIRSIAIVDAMPRVEQPYADLGVALSVTIGGTPCTRCRTWGYASSSRPPCLA